MAGDWPRPLQTQAMATWESEPMHREEFGRSRHASSSTSPMALISPKLMCSRQAGSHWSTVNCKVDATSAQCSASSGPW
eukprot:1505962-Lingulodinium_polyedra.AAC.1